MKIFWVHFFAVSLFSHVSLAQYQHEVDDAPIEYSMNSLAKQLANSFESAMMKRPVPKGSKIYVLPFIGRSDMSDTLRTPLGIKLSSAIAFRLKEVCQSWRKLKRLELNIINSEDADKNLHEVMRGYFTPPATQAEESALWQNISNNMRPDYYLMAKYSITGEYVGANILEATLVKDKFNPSPTTGPATVAIGRAKTTFYTKLDQDNFRKWNNEITRLDQTFVNFVNFKTKASFASYFVFDETNNMALPKDSAFQVGNAYNVKLTLSEDAYVYAFYYESNDMTGNQMYMIFPFDNGQTPFFKKGTYELPDSDNSFSPSPPASNQAFIKVVASKNPLPLQISTTTEGYRIFEKEACNAFLKAMQQANPVLVYSANLIKEVK
jgi:hypothetical protein